MKRRRISDAELAARDAAWRARYEAGESAEAIARSLGVYSSSVNAAIRRAGGTLRDYNTANAERRVSAERALMFDDKAGALDIIGAERVDIRVRADGKVIWVNADGGLRLRICQINGAIIVADDRRFAEHPANIRLCIDNALAPPAKAIPPAEAIEQAEHGAHADDPPSVRATHLEDASAAAVVSAARASISIRGGR